MTTHENRSGFTLIELLTVIAIISILAGIIAVGLPRAIERARLASLDGTFRGIDTVLSAYLSEHGSYPPGYGYLRWDDRFQGDFSHVVVPWTAILGIYNNADINDPFSESYDTNGNERIDFLEFLPIFDTLPDGSISYPPQLYEGPGQVPALATQEARQLQQTERPVLYIPINLNDFNKVTNYANRPSVADVDTQYMRSFATDATNGSHLGIAQITPPVGDSNGPYIPPKYDAYVLISPGPAKSTSGVLQTPDDTLTDNYYYIAGLQTYFLATRDANNSGTFDMDYNARKGPDGGAAAFQGNPYGPGIQMYLLPDRTGGQGPRIHAP